MSLFNLDLPALVEALGVAGVALVVFLESGIPFGFFFPGDSLLFTAGLIASKGFLDMPALLIALPVAAILGDSAGYWLGAVAGRSLMERPRFFVRPSHIERTRLFFERHGTRAVILARFVPIVRTFTPLLAGAGSMRYPLFLRFNVIGGVLWTVLVTSAGYTLGSVIPGSEKLLLPLSAAVILISFIPILAELWRNGSGTRGKRGE
ncbi:MAG: VTT domain-containing protein [Patescibacteria group bacterium]|nr:VTT domain-containing protein [Patescibacteria group bacterium]MDE1966090.1 VTT domain-containing protein [Patescibacteria group bacterium]